MKISFIIPTLMRESIWQTIASIRQTCNYDYEILVRYDPTVNEYVSRNLAIEDSTGDVLAFIDDDAMYGPHSIDRAMKYMQDPTVVFVDGSVVGNLMGTGNVKFNWHHMGIGTTEFIKKQALLSTGLFPTAIYGTKPEDGWRMDTIVLYNILKKYGAKAYKHCEDMDVQHPNPMASQWNPYIEVMFYQIYNKEIEKYLLTQLQDPRIDSIKRNYDTLVEATKRLGVKEFNDIVRKHSRIGFEAEVVEALKNAKHDSSKNS